MTENLKELIKIYSCYSHKELNIRLLEYSKDDLIAVFNDLLTLYINDKNSSTIREFLTVNIAGYTHNTHKIGFNGYRQNGLGKAINCEAKPKNICTSDEKIKKLNGSGNFTDYTWARFEKDKKSNLNMLISGFIDGQLIYILEFNFCEKSFLNKLQSQLEKHFPNGDESGRYLRSANFNFKDYINAKIKCIFIKQNINDFKKYIQLDFFNFLKDMNC